MAKHDAIIPTGPAAFGRPGQLTVIDLLGEMKRNFDEKWQRDYAQALLNERYINGQQFMEIASNNREVVASTRVAGLPPIRRNLLRNFALTWASRVTKNRPDTKAWPNEAGGDIETAKIANLVLDYYKQATDRDRMLSKSAMLAQPHTCVYFKVSWDPSKGPTSAGYPALDAAGNVLADANGDPVIQGAGHPEGDVAIDLLTIFDITTDGAEEIEHAQWALCRRHIDRYAAKSLLLQADIQDDPQVDIVSDAWDNKVEGVPVYEIWHLPTPRIPDGLFAVIVGDAVVEARAFPYAHKQLPFSKWKIFDKRNSQFGDSHVSDCIDLQRGLNEMMSALAKIAYLHGTDIKAIAPSKIEAEWQNGSQIIASEDPNDAIRWSQPPAPPAILLQMIELYMDAIPESFGINEAVASGGSPSQTKSARQLAYISELDAQKLSNAKRNLDSCLVRVDTQVLELVQQYVPNERIVQVVGKDNEPYALAFRGADIGGVDVRIEPAPGSERYHAAHGAYAEESAVAGFMDPARASELRTSGLDETFGDAQQRQLVQKQIMQLAHGQETQADPAIDPGVAMSEIQMAIAVWEEHRPDLVQPLQQLLAIYRDLGKQSQQEAAPQQKPKSSPGAEAQAQEQGQLQ